ncbi:MAG: cation transporter [Chloroflexi bacterium]|nr:MAG: cation transporter [Chloroflexota bacterium]
MHEFYQTALEHTSRNHSVITPKSGYLSIVRRNLRQYNQPMTHQRSSPVDERDRKSLWAINLGLGFNIFLSIVKTTFGILAHSPALLAEGINSTSDVAYYVVASVFMRLANKPADDEHPYGHRQLESIASLIVGAFVIATAITVFWDAADKMWDLTDGKLTTLGSHPFALWVALTTVVIKIILFFYVRKLGRETHNPIVDALAFDHRNDIFSASAASVGIFLSQVGVLWGDPLAGALVALLILRTGVYILRESSVELMDAVPSKELAQQISTLIKNVGGVQQLEELQAHRFGPHLVVNLTIGINGALTVRQGDGIATNLEALIYESIPSIRHIHVHYHPAEDVRRNMSIDDILAQTRRHVAAHEVFINERDESNVLSSPKGT